MNCELYRLVYLSRNNISNEGDSLRNEISHILRSARENNWKNNITGALMFNSEYFAQVLEGPQHEVQKLFDHIKNDDRHSEMSMLSFSPVESRGFPEWAMAYVGEDPDLSDRFFMIGEETNFNLEDLSGEEIYVALLQKLQESECTPNVKDAA